jgi:hypothetical protein
MKFRTTLMAVTLWLSAIAGALAQSPIAVPPLPDTPRISQYSISATTCSCSVGFALFGEGTDVDNWIHVYIGSTRYLSTDPVFGWRITVPSGTLATNARPISNGTLVFNSAQTGIVTVLGARRPRRISQFSESRGATARDLNQALTDIIADQREAWDRVSRAIVGQPGETFNLLPPAASRLNSLLGFDGTTGQPTLFPPASGLAALAPNSINNTLLAQMAANTVKCNPTSLGNVQDCTVAQFSTFLSSNNNLASPLYLFNANTITSPASPSSPAYQFKFGPPLAQFITDSNRSAIVGQSVQNQSAAAILPAVIGYGVLAAAGVGNQVQGMFARGECQAAGGCTGIEIDAWNTSGTNSPDSYPAADSFGTSSVWTFGTKIAAAGTNINWAGIHFVQEPTTPGNSQFRAGIYATPAVFQHYGGFFDADATHSPTISWLIRNTGLSGNVPVIVQTMGTYTKAGVVLESLDLSGNVVTQFRQDGGMLTTISPSASAGDPLAWALTNTKGGAGAFAGFTGTSDAGTLTLTAGPSATGSAATVRWSGGGSLLIDALNATGNISLRTGATPSNAITISAAQLVALPAIPTSAGAGGLNVCVDTSGVLYKKASCP